METTRTTRRLGGGMVMPFLPIGRLLAGRTDEVIRQRRKTLRTSDREAIHRLRVATRRLQEALDLARPVLDPRPLRRLDRRARRLRRILGLRRNHDVMRELLRSVGRRLRPEAREIARRLGRGLEAPTAGRSAPLPPIRKRANALLRTAAHGRALPMDARARQVLEERAREVRERLGAGRGENGERLHRLRIAVKRYRYSLELLDEAGLEGLQPAIRSARVLQRDLGNLHDLDLLIDLARRRTAGADRRILVPALQALRPPRLLRARASLRRFRVMCRPGPLGLGVRWGVTP